MPNDQTENEKRLEKLGKRLQKGAAALHPVTERELEKVRKALKERAQEQKPPEVEKDRDHDRGH
jgi:hypothetical protein